MQYIQFLYQGKEIYLVDMKQASKPFSALTESALKKYGDKKQITLLASKNSFSHGVICKECGTIPFCTQCDVAIAYYQDVHKQYFGLCSYCKTQYPSPATCQQCHSHDLDFYGIGAQQIQEILQKSYQLHAEIIDARTANSFKKLDNIKKTRSITIGTNLLIHPQPNTDILIILNADQGLQFPDYSSRRNSFLQLYEAISKHPGKQIILQSYHTEDWILLLACKADLVQAQHNELTHREILSYPPFVDMCLFLYKDEIEEKLFSTIHKLHKEILYLQEKQDRKDITIIATPPLVYKLHGKFRYSILFKGKDIRPFIETIYETLEIKKRWFMVDWMPVATL